MRVLTTLGTAAALTLAAAAVAEHILRCGHARFVRALLLRRIVVGGALVAMAAMTLLVPNATATAPGTVEVQVKSEWDVTGLRPNGTTVNFLLKAVADGSDPSTLIAGGRIEGSNRAISEWSGTGAISGDVVTLTGVVTDSNASFLIGSPVKLVADASTNFVTFVFGPLAGGPFAGKTINAEGPARVTIRS